MLDAITEQAVIKLGPDGEVVRWSGTAQAMTGYAQDETVGRSVEILHTPEDRDAGMVGQELDAARQGGRRTFQGWRVRKSGERFLARITLTPVHGEDGAVTGFIKSLKDVTEAARAESLFHGLLESAPDAMLIVGPDARIVLVNRRTEALFGFERDELVGREIEVLVPPGSAAVMSAIAAGSSPTPGCGRWARVLSCTGCDGTAPSSRSRSA